MYVYVQTMAIYLSSIAMIQQIQKNPKSDVNKIAGVYYYILTKWKH